MTIKQFFEKLYTQASAAQRQRSAQYSIAIKKGIAIPLPDATEADYGDPVNYLFLTWHSVGPDLITTKQMNELRNSEAMFKAAKYDAASTKAIQGRIDAALAKFNIGEFTKTVEFVPFEKSEDRQLIYGVVLRPNWQDYHGDIIPTDDVEQAAHRWMLNGQKLDWQHQELIDPGKVAVVESYIAPVDFVVDSYEIKKGDWVMGVHVIDKMLWTAIKDGKVAMAFSITGRGRRIKV